MHVEHRRRGSRQVGPGAQQQARLRVEESRLRAANDLGHVGAFEHPRIGRSVVQHLEPDLLGGAGVAALGLLPELFGLRGFQRADRRACPPAPGAARSRRR
ncbi:hypothetical protein E1161_15135 [Saccharopolyspora aridisoli]|uniref:Uncharacterized protein n=1 Tax=Saccharopolyspora aridisoli TaxID=2530385 RepID=A0A4R4URZ1_9PSEU|nr:hypothetical protein [Saccharopolyspora aridisoli]TDC91884.1 hypothetical protein E1161_15135 [Saccharopolyspora aridisoli]